jgi:multiple sugar transport system ATP-binding protein
VLRLIAGLEKPTAGSIHIDGLEVTVLPAQRRDVAFAFQSPALYPHLSVQRNLAYPMRAQFIPRNVIERRVNQVIERFGLDALRRRKPGTLSAVDCQLVSLARTAVRDPKAFLIDEPLAPFEGEQREHVRRELRSVHEELRGTTILATREPPDAIVLADRIVVMNEGRVLQNDTPQAVYDRPADLFVAHYLGAQAMNFLDARRDGDGSVRLACCDLTVSVDDRGAHPVDPQRLTLGIRPEHVRLDPRGVETVVSQVESDGDAQLVRLQLGNATLCATIPTSRQVVQGERVGVRLEPAGCRWFDATSGKALPWRTA